MNEELRILLVEDQEDDALLVGRALRGLERPFTTRRVACEEDCRRELEAFRPDVVLSDMSMPGFHGLRALEIVQELGVEAPFIFVSGTLDGEAAVDLLKRGAVDYVQKAHLCRLVPSVVRALREAWAAREALRAEENYRGIFQNAILGIYQSTPDGRFVAANPALARLLGYESPDGLLEGPAHLAEMFTDPKKGQELLERLAESGEVRTFEAEIFRRDRSRIWVAWHARSVPPRHGAGALCEGFVEDLTQHRDMEARMQHARRLESIGTLAGGVAHDLNNVLAPILMASSMLRSAVTAPEHVRMLSLVQACAERGTEIIRQVGVFSSGGKAEWRPLQIAYIIKDVLKVVADTFPNAIAIESVVDRNLRSVPGDAARLRQAVLALCTNARDAMPEGGSLHLRARNADLDADALAALSQDAAPGSFVVLEVADTGTGIPPEIKERIFDPFFTTKGIGKGTGLGLSEVCGIVKTHGGFIEVTSVGGSGTTFQIYLPAAAKSSTTHGPVAPQVTPRPPVGAGRTILLVDDEEAIRLAVRAALMTQNFRVLTAENGTAALRIFAENREAIDTVVTDFMMPGMDGAALTQALRIIDPEVSIIISSGRGSRPECRSHSTRRAGGPGQALLDGLAVAHAGENFTRDAGGRVAPRHQARRPPPSCSRLSLSRPECRRHR